LCHHHFETILTFGRFFVFVITNTLKIGYFDLIGFCFGFDFKLLIVGDVAFITYVVCITNSLAIGTYLQADGVVSHLACFNVPGRKLIPGVQTRAFGKRWAGICPTKAMEK